MTSHTHDRPPVAARTAGAILLTALLLTSPLTVPASAANDTAALLGQAESAKAASAPTGPHALEGSSGSAPELSSSQEGSWFLGRPVDSVLGPGQWYTTEEGRTWYGAYRTFDDEYAYCVDAGLKTPHPRFFTEGDGGETIDAATAAWALSTHTQSDSVPVQAALSALVRLDDSIPHRHAIEPGHPADLGEEFEDAAAQFDAINEESSRFAGPYSLDVEIRPRMLQAYDGRYGPPLVEAANEDHLLLRGFPLEAVVSLTSASGHQMTGHRVRLSAAGASAREESIVVGEEPAVVSLADLASEDITVDAVASDLPATSVILHRPRGLGSDRVQAVVTAGEPVTVTAQGVYDRGPEPDPGPEAPDRPQLPQPEQTNHADEPRAEESEGPRVEVHMPRPTTLPLPSDSPESPESPDQSDSPDRPEAPDEGTEPTASASPSPPPVTAQPVPERTHDAPRKPDAPGTQDAPRSPDATQEPEATHPPRPGRTAEPQQSSVPSASPPSEPSASPPSVEEDDPAQKEESMQEEETVPASLPRTGTDSTTAIGLAITLLAVGAGAVTLSRRNSGR